MSLYDSQTYLKDLEEAAKNSINLEQIKNKSILVTGATGTIGSFVVDMLLHYNRTDKAGVKVYALGRSINRLAERFGKAKTESLIYVEHDVCNQISFDFPLDYIIHTAGNAHPAAFNGDPVGTIIGNVTGTYSLLEYGRKHGAKRLLYVSSGEVYGQGDLSLNEFEESYSGYLDTMLPRSCYPSSKRTAETLCASYSKQYGLETVIVRPCHTYGPSITASDSRANAQFFRNVINNEDIIMKSAGLQMRSYCYIADCASAIMTVLIAGKSGEAYNIANRNARITIAGLAVVIAEKAGRKVVFTDPNTDDLANRTPIAKQVLSSKKLESLGWEGKYGIKEGISNTLAILQEK